MLFDYMFNDFENNLREMGFGDIAVNKKMKLFIRAFYGRLSQYSKSLDLVEKEDDIFIYPNPARTLLNLESSTPILSAVLRNVFGQVVLEVNENDIKVVDLRNVPNGNYLLTLSNGDKFSAQKVNVLK